MLLLVSLVHSMPLGQSIGEVTQHRLHCPSIHGSMYPYKSNDTMTDFPTDSELRELQSEVDDILSQDCDDWVDSMMMGILEDIQY